MALCFIRACFESEYRLRGSTTKILLNGKGFSKKEKPCKIARIFVGFDTHSVWLFENSLIHPSPQRKTALISADFHGGEGWIRTTEVTDNRFTVCPLWPLGNSPIFTCALKRKLGAGRRTRTPDLLITNQLLYQLSYTSISATEWILADAAPFVKPKFFIFREEGLLHFKICSPAEKRRPYGRPCGRCSLCGCELLRGERGWYLNGQSVCADCFPAFARAELAPCETVFGMEGEA